MQRHSPLRRRHGLMHGRPARESDAERTLWSVLRKTQMAGQRFRRGCRVGPYVVAFFCPGAMLVIELDGPNGPEAACDEQRSAWLSGHGYRVLRFRDVDVLKNLRGVLDVIAAAFEIRSVSLPHRAPK
ncbi:MAG: DUF559 domain-containing protein [Alphaproteobacteria bacterium]|nr:DUF559 domain-containing protein [Alphaproteobacteria bacterium]